MIGARPSSGSSSSSSLRVQHQRAADRQHLLLAARELRAQIRLALGKAREHLVHALRHSRDWAGPRHGREVLVHRERLEDVALLRHPADAGGRALVRRELVQSRLPTERDGPPCWRVAPGQRVDQRRLARAVAAEQRERLPFAERERHVVQHHGLAVARAQVVDAQQLRHVLAVPWPR
jgi:hypothetical protein